MQQGTWTPAQLQPLIDYTNLIGGEIAAAEMSNQASHAHVSYGGTPEGYNADAYAKDFARFKK